MVGSHIIKTWSATQASIALSSGEAEFYGVVRAAGIALGHRSLMLDLGLNLPARVWTDSSAAMGICARQGLGKLRHIECHTLWVQQRLRQKDFELRKVRGEVNPADLFTKFLESRVKIDQLISLFSCEMREGRPAAAPMLKRGPTAFDGSDMEQDALKMLDDAQMHDPCVLPHEYEATDIDRMFPNIVAPPQEEFGERDIEGQDQDLADPIDEPYTIRVHRPHRLGEATTTTTTTTTTSTPAKAKAKARRKANNDGITICHEDSDESLLLCCEQGDICCKDAENKEENDDDDQDQKIRNSPEKSCSEAWGSTSRRRPAGSIRSSGCPLGSATIRSTRDRLNHCASGGHSSAKLCLERSMTTIELMSYGFFCHIFLRIGRDSLHPRGSGKICCQIHGIDMCSYLNALIPLCGLKLLFLRH